MPTWYDGHVLKDTNHMIEGNVMTWKLEQFDYWGAVRWRAIDTSGKRRPFTGASPEGFVTEEAAAEALQAALAYTKWIESKEDARTVDMLRDVEGTLRYMATDMWTTTVSDVETATVDDSETACPERSSRQLVSTILREAADRVDAVVKLLGMVNASMAEVLHEDDHTGNTCPDCDRPTWYSDDDEQWYHADPARECFLATGKAPPTNDHSGGAA